MKRDQISREKKIGRLIEDSDLKASDSDYKLNRSKYLRDQMNWRISIENLNLQIESNRNFLTKSII